MASLNLHPTEFSSVHSSAQSKTRDDMHVIVHKGEEALEEGDDFNNNVHGPCFVLQPLASRVSHVD